MKTAYKLGSQWITRGNWRAVVLAIDEFGNIKVWHEDGNEYMWHSENGTSDAYPNHDLLTKYEEPRTGTAWVNVWAGTESKPFCLSYDTEKDYLSDRSYTGAYKLIASFKYEWVEGETVE